MVCFSSSCIYLPHIDTSRNASMCLKNAAEEGQTWIIVVFDNFYSDEFLKHLHAFLEIASTQKVCAGSRERTKYHLKNVENCQEHVQFWVWKICDTIIIGNDWYIFSNPELNTFLTILDADEVISGSFSGFCTYLLRRSYLQKCF